MKYRRSLKGQSVDGVTASVSSRKQVVLVRRCASIDA